MAVDSFPARCAGTSVDGASAKFPPCPPVRATLVVLALARARGTSVPLPAPGVRLGGPHPALT
eukprot:9602838-Alexandrium_andersonii.AAC.1